MPYCDVFVFLHNAYRVRTFFCTCLWVMETWARRQPQGTDWPLLRLLYPCFLPRTSPRRCLLIQCAAAKLATRGGQFRLTLWFLAFLFLFCFFSLILNEFVGITGRSLPSRRGSRSSCRTTGRSFATWCATSTDRRERHLQMTTTSL